MTVRSNQASGREVGELVGRGRIDARVDRPAHQGHGRGCAGSFVGREQRHGGQHRHRGLAHGDDVQIAGASCRMIVDDQVDIVVEIEAAVEHRHVARIDPVGDVDVVIGAAAARPCRAAASRNGPRAAPRAARAAARRAYSFSKCSRLQNGWRATTLSRTGDALARDLDGGDAEIGALVPHAGARHHLARGGGAAHQRMMRQHRPGLLLSSRSAARAIQRTGAKSIGVRLIGFVVEHRDFVLIPWGGATGGLTA